MIKYSTILLSFTALLILTSINASSVQEFCVADYTAPPGPAGYPCKNPTDVTSDDFIFRGFREAGDTSNSINVSVTPAFDAQFPGLNGLGLSLARVDFGRSGLTPLHSHPGASEALLVVEGELLAGFFSFSHNIGYVRVLRTGDVMLFPQGLMHFQSNGFNSTVAYSSFSSANPGYQIFPCDITGTQLRSLLEDQKTGFLDDEQLKKLKNVFGARVHSY